MSDIGRWLEINDLGKYADVFAENEIVLGDLPELTDADIAGLGLPLGPRRRLQKAVRELIENAIPEDLDEESAHAPNGAAERRQLTVMFCDLVGSTALSETMDTEDYRELLSAYQTAASSAINEHGGYIARFMGDGLLVYFGYPVAQENDAERSARAGLAVIEAVATLASAVPLQVRVGIATGPVVVGDIVGEGASEEAAVLGETPNLAARLQSAAAPNTVLMSPSTQQLLHGGVETDALSPVELKGLSRPIVPYRAVRTRSLSEVSEGRSDSTPLIGRAVEVALLQRAWQHALGSEGQAVLVTGEAGVGKSRLLRAFQEAIGETERTRVQWFCSPYYQTTPNYPAVEQLGRTLGTARLRGKPLDTLEAMVRELELDPEEIVPALARLLSVPVGDPDPASAWSAEEMKRRVVTAQVELLQAAARHAPVLFVVEDLHWADPTTLEVLGEMIEALRDERVLALMTARPEFKPPWSERSHVMTQRLASLSRQETMALVRGIAEEHGLPAQIVAQIVERTDGVPLFIEELTRSLLESTDAAAIPSSLQDLLMARLDRLGSTKELAQIASIIGRSFTLDSLVPIAERSNDAVEQGLAELVECGLAHQRSSGGYEFKHALIRDAAYNSLLRDKRRDLHARYAELLVSRGAKRHEPELLAQHYSEAAMPQEAAQYWTDAGTRALARSSVGEAAQHFVSAQDAYSQLPQSPQRIAAEIEIAQHLGEALTAKNGRGDAEALAAFETAVELSERAKDSQSKLNALRGLCQSLLSQAPAKAIGPAQELLALAEQLGDYNAHRHGCSALVASNYLLGNFKAAVVQAQEQLDILAQDTTGNVQESVVFYPSSDLRRHCAMCFDALGQRETAARYMAEARAISESMGQPFTITHALVFSAKLMVWQRQFEEAKTFAEAGLALAEEHGFGNWHAVCSVLLGRALTEVGDPAQGIGMMRDGISRWRSSSWDSEWHTHLTGGLLAAGLVEDARIAVNRAEELRESVGAQHYGAECLRLQGVVAQQQGGNRSQVERHFVAAIDLARAQEAKTFELQAAIELAGLWGQHGDRQAALELLTPLCIWFEEGRALPVLQEAKALLSELR